MNLILKTGLLRVLPISHISKLVLIYNVYDDKYLSILRKEKDFPDHP